MPLFLRFYRDRSGANAVEFALIAPVLILVMSGIINYGLYFSTSHALQQIANNAARNALAGLTQAERLELAQGTLAQDVTTYSFLSADRALLKIDEGEHALTVTLTYANTSIGLPFIEPPTEIERVAIIARGEY
jgi:Flp pilus assembly protein TadG